MEIDFELLKKQIDYVRKKGVHGIVACGINGEFPSMDINERKKVIETTINTVNEQIPVIVGCYSSNIKDSVDLIKFSENAGASAAIITTPYFFTSPPEEGLYDFFSKILDEVKRFPILLCNVPIYTLIEISTTLVDKLVKKYRNIAGIKDLSGKPESFTAYAGVFENLSVLIGSDKLVFHGLNVKGDGAVSAIACILPDYVLNIFNTYKKGNIDQAWIEQEKLSGIRALLKRFPSRAAQKFIFSKITGVESFVRPPLCNLTHDEKDNLLLILEEHGLLKS